MKTKLYLLPFLALSLTLLFPSVSLAKMDYALSYDINLAQKAGQAWLDKVSVTSPGLSKWRGALVGSPQVYRNLNGEINAYLFNAFGKDSIVGYTLVGSSLYKYSIFHAGTAAPPSIPEKNIVKSAFGKIGIGIDSDKIGNPSKMLYLGADGYYAVYEVDGKQIAINLISQKAKFLSELKSTMLSPEKYEEAKKLIKESKKISTLSEGYFYIENIHWWNGYRLNPPDPSKGWCGPCSGVSIGAYYRDFKGYSGIKTPNQDLYDRYYNLMQTVSDPNDLFYGATFKENYGNGFVLETIQDGNYSNFNDINDEYVHMDDYWVVVSNIDFGRPTALLITYPDMHWRAIKGYSYDDYWNNYQIICTTSTHPIEDDYEFKDWTDLGYFLFTSIHGALVNCAYLFKNLFGRYRYRQYFIALCIE